MDEHKDEHKDEDSELRVRFIPTASQLMTSQTYSQELGVFEAVLDAREALIGWSDEKARCVDRYLQCISRFVRSRKGAFLVESKKSKSYLSKLTISQVTALEILRLAIVELADVEDIREAHGRLKSLFIDELKPDAMVGRVRKKQLQKAGFGSNEEQQEKHNQWRRWQAHEKATSPQFARKSKQDQARRLQEKYSIPEKISTIAKKILPLSSQKK